MDRDETRRRVRPAAWVLILGGILCSQAGCQPAWMTKPNAPIDGRPVPSLHRAAMRGDVAATMRLLDGGADVEETFDRGVTNWAQQFRNGEPQPSDQGLTALHLAVEQDQTAVVRLLLERDAPIGALDGLKRTPLALATNLLKTDSAEVLIEFGADVNGRFEDVPLLQLAIVSACAARAAQEAFASSMAQSGYAVPRGALDIGDDLVVLLLAHGAKIDARNAEGGTALHVAAAGGAAAIAKTLIDNGADLNARMQNGKTPLDLADENDHSLTAALLRQRGGVNRAPG